jgi:hypothetical protein
MHIARLDANHVFFPKEQGNFIFDIKIGRTRGTYATLIITVGRRDSHRAPKPPYKFEEEEGKKRREEEEEEATPAVNPASAANHNTNHMQWSIRGEPDDYGGGH